MARDMLTRALEIAREAHAGQVDKAGRPVIEHVLRVVDAVEGEDVKAVAALHDVLETTGEDPADLGRRGDFSRDITDDVWTLTRAINDSYRAYIGWIQRGTPRARLVKLTDLRDHLHPDRVGALAPTHVERYRRALKVLEGTP